ncbi:hypothetical protein CERZMDRAFT_101401 [Cercospora zeae-maydis SCOH1-5]|uniref:MYND-type zinc finger protein samB n=1 Tax=Cercospora zeae-maydis SCOH1-5 TaxID=717836 RepID=A0A6A6F6U4_9PEZI|nr:hypothetical protein CERZMDRAFT_101401 [Cercospora zeae-maydis SCOH1-5]
MAPATTTTTSPSPDDGTTSNVNCSACGCVASRPHLTCFECTEGVDVHGNPDSIQYCTASCRDSAAADHKSDCEKRNVRKQIYRAGELLQSSFYRLKELNFLMKVTKAYQSKGIVYFHQLPLARRTAVFETAPYDVASYANDARAIISLSKCEEALVTHFEFSRKLLGGTAKYIEEVAFDDVGPKLRAKEVFLNGKSLEVYRMHQVLCVQTEADESYIIDMTGAQFGQPKGVLPLETAVAFYGNKLVQIWPHGHYSSELLRTIEEEVAGSIGANPRDRIIPAYMATLFNKKLAYWEDAHGCQVSRLLNSKHQDFELLKTTINKLVVEASRQGRAVLRKIPPVKVIPHIEVANNDKGNLSRPVIPAISKEYTGSRIGKKCRRHILNTLQRQEPERWQNYYQPLLAMNGSIPMSFDDKESRRKALEKMHRDFGNPNIEALRVMMDKAAKFWACEALAN